MNTEGKKKPCICKEENNKKNLPSDSSSADTKGLLNPNEKSLGPK